MEESNVSDWDRLPNGGVDTEEVVAWAVASALGHALLRLEILMADGSIEYIQLRIPAGEAADLALCLAERAQRAMPSGDSPRH